MLGGKRNLGSFQSRACLVPTELFELKSAPQAGKRNVVPGLRDFFRNPCYSWQSISKVSEVTTAAFHDQVFLSIWAVDFPENASIFQLALERRKQICGNSHVAYKAGM
jgi:hypothetical protein